jgi:hypothetical protein
LPLLKLPLRKLPKSPLLRLLLPKLPKLPLLKHPKPPLLRPLLRPVLWARLKPPEQEALGQVSWLMLRLLLKLLRQWVDKALVRLELKRQWNQPCKVLAVRRVVLPESLKPLVVQQRPLLVLIPML